MFYGVEPFEQIAKTILTEDPMRNLMKISQAVSEQTVSEKKAFKDYMIIYLNIVQGQQQMAPAGVGGILIVTKTKQFYVINQTS